MTITVAAEGTGFAVFQVCYAVILAKDMLSIRKVYFGSFIKHVNKNNLLKCQSTLLIEECCEPNIV